MRVRLSRERGDDPTVGRKPSWGWVSELGGEHWEPRIREGHPKFGEKRGTPRCCMEDSKTGYPRV